jgi:plastocyanin
MPRRVLFLIATLALLFVGSLAAGPTASAGGGCHADVAGAVHNDAATSVVRMDVCSFEPTVARVAVGAQVSFLNTAGNEHVVAGRGNSWGGEVLEPGARLVQQFDAEGIFPYSCPLHPGMTGAIVVGGADVVPAAAVLDPASRADAGAAEDTSDGAWLTGAGGLLAGVVLGGLAMFLVRRRYEAGPTTA